MLTWAHNTFTVASALVPYLLPSTFQIPNSLNPCTAWQWGSYRIAFPWPVQLGPGEMVPHLSKVRGRRLADAIIWCMLELPPGGIQSDFILSDFWKLFTMEVFFEKLWIYELTSSVQYMFNFCLACYFIGCIYGHFIVCTDGWKLFWWW